MVVGPPAYGYDGGPNIASSRIKVVVVEFTPMPGLTKWVMAVSVTVFRIMMPVDIILTRPLLRVVVSWRMCRITPFLEPG